MLSKKRKKGRGVEKRSFPSLSTMRRGGGEKFRFGNEAAARRQEKKKKEAVKAVPIQKRLAQSITRKERSKK